MLHKFLETLHNGNVNSIADIASAMNISPAMALHMAQELARKGYLEEIGSDCCGSQPPCPGCTANTNGQPTVKRWFLTEKGLASISHR